MAQQDEGKQIAKYISDAFQKVNDYKNDVESGKKVSSKWIKLAVQRSRKDEKRTDIKFDYSAVERVFQFFFYIRIKRKLKYGRFVLTPYQAWILSEIFGWYSTKNEGKRRYRYATLFTARKSGKTVFSVAIELYMLIGDREEDPEAYLCATTKEQATQALDYTKKIIRRSPSLQSRLKVQQYKILYLKRAGILKVLANKPDSNDSLNPYVFILDEMHAHPTLDFFNVMKSGTLQRRNPLGIITSTAGFHKEYPFFKMIELAKKVLMGLVTDDITFYALYTLDDDDDVEDYDKWEKANPNIGGTIDLDTLIEEWEKAKLLTSERRNFITKNLNRYTDNDKKWIPDDQYKKNFLPVNLPLEKKGKHKIKAYAGLDLSSVRDFSALVISFTDPETGKLALYPEFYFPSKSDKRVRENGIDLTAWIEAGYITECEGATIDHELIYQRIEYFSEIFDLQIFLYDPHNSAFIGNRLGLNLYIDARPFGQNPVNFNFPLKYLEKLMFDENVLMSENPVMRWQFQNIELYYDGNGNIKIMKNKSLDSVDGPVAAGMAIGAWLMANGDETAAFFQELMEQHRNSKE